MTLTISTAFLWFLFDLFTSAPLWVFWLTHSKELHWTKRYVVFAALLGLTELGAEMAARGRY